MEKALVKGRDAVLGTHRVPVERPRMRVTGGSGTGL
jgi:hypothetical protein